MNVIYWRTLFQGQQCRIEWRDRIINCGELEGTGVEEVGDVFLIYLFEVRKNTHRSEFRTGHLPNKSQDVLSLEIIIRQNLRMKLNKCEMKKFSCNEYRSVWYEAYIVVYMGNTPCGIVRETKLWSRFPKSLLTLYTEFYMYVCPMNSTRSPFEQPLSMSCRKKLLENKFGKRRVNPLKWD